MDEFDMVETQETFEFQGKRVLLAEDNSINAEMYGIILTKMGASVTVVPNGEEAVNALENQGCEAYDLVLMDVHMPVLDGREATKQIRRHTDIPIFALSVSDAEEERTASLEAGMDGQFVKPLDFKVVEGAISKYMSGR